MKKNVFLEFKNWIQLTQTAHELSIT